MSDLEILTRVLLALGFGAILGLETETRASEEVGRRAKSTRDLLHQRIGGVRTYTVLSLFGSFGGILFAIGQPVFAYLMFVAVFLAVLAAYIMNIKFYKRFGMTTEISVLITVLIGFATTAGLISPQILVILIVILAFILSQKRGVARLTSSIAHQELEDVVKFLIVVIVIFPLLPNQDLRLSDIQGIAPALKSFGVSSELTNNLVVLNPRRLWEYVVLISGFNLLGYFATRALGKTRGLVVTGGFGGFVSSTSTTIAFALKSRKSEAQYIWNNLSAATLVANSASFIPIVVLAATTSVMFLSGVLPISIALALGSILVAIWYMHHNSHELEKNVKLEYEPYSIGPAIKFAVLLTVARVFIQLASLIAGPNALVVSTALSGFLGINIATITLGEFVAKGGTTVELALITYLIVNAVNYGAKSFYSYMQGAREYFRMVTIGLMVSIALGAAGLVLILGYI